MSIDLALNMVSNRPTSGHLGPLPKAQASLEELCVRSLCHHPAVLELDDAVAVADRSQAVCYEDDGELPPQSVDGAHHGLFCGVVQRAGGLIEHQHAGTLV